MPELPEVETVRRQLETVVPGRRIVSVECGPPSYFFLTRPELLKKHLVGRKAVRLTRHGKAMTLELDDKSRLLLHLGMTGQIVTRALPKDRHVHLVLGLSGKKVLTFRDVRKFGKVEWIAPGASCPRLTKLGPDALSITKEALGAALSTRKVAIKSALLNQELLAGVGNIYADEALFLARIHPERSAKELKPKEVTLLAQEIRSLLSRAVESGGSTINDYLRPDGTLGGFQDWHQVYGKEGEPCPRCKGPILRLVIGARSTHFCPKCQK